MLNLLTKYLTMLDKLKKTDIFFFIYISISSLLIIFSLWGEDMLVHLLLIRLIILILVFGILFFHKQVKSKLSDILREAYPLILSAYFYQETVNYNKLFFSNLDPYLEKADFYIFGIQPAISFSECISNHLFSELMYFSYFTFYLLIIGFFLIYYLQKGDKLSKNVFYLTASLYLFYLIFAIFPSAGPQYFFESPQNILPSAYIFDNIMHLVQKFGEQPTGAFPSSHVGISIIILILFRKDFGNYFKIALPIVFLLILSTVYIKAHYVVDVVAGIVFAPLILFLSKKLYNYLPGK